MFNNTDGPNEEQIDRMFALSNQLADLYINWDLEQEEGKQDDIPEFLRAIAVEDAQRKIWSALIPDELYNAEIEKRATASAPAHSEIADELQEFLKELTGGTFEPLPYDPPEEQPNA